MRIPQILAGALAMTCAMCIAHAEKTVFKCAGPNGATVFSPTPCGKDAKEVDVSKSSSLGAPVTNDAIQGISRSVADIRCRDDAFRSTQGSANDEIRPLQAERDRLQRDADLLTANSGLAADQVSDEVRRGSYVQQITAIDARIEQKRSAGQDAYRKAMSNCEEKRDAAETAAAH